MCPVRTGSSPTLIFSINKGHLMCKRGGNSLSLSLFLSLFTIAEAPRSKNSRKLHHSKHQTKTTPTSVNQLPINPNSPITHHSPENTRNQPQAAQPVTGFLESEKQPNGPSNHISVSHQTKTTITFVNQLPTNTQNFRT